MGFIPQNLHNDAIERDLFEDFWGMVKGGASKETLRTALLAVIGVTLKERIKDAEKPEREQKKSPEHEGESEGEGEEQEEKESPTEWGFYDEDEEFCFRPREHGKVFAYFKNFYINRVQYVGLN